MLTLTVISLLAGLFVWWQAVCPLRCKWWVKLLLSGLILVAALYFRIMKAVGGPLPLAPDVPVWFQLGYGWVYMVLMFYCLLLVAASFALVNIPKLLPRKIVLRWGLKWGRMTMEARHSLLNRVLAALLAAAALLVSVGMSNALRLPEVKELSISLPVKERVRVALLTDLHADAVKQREFIRAVVERVNALQPDAVLIVGDLVDGTVEQRGSALEPLRELESPYRFAVPGNHEYYYDYRAWGPYLATLGLRLLNNEHEVLEPQGLVIAGVTDPDAQGFGQEEPNVEKACNGAPAGMPILLLAHQPQLAPQAEAAGVALQVSGHTHGGLMPVLEGIIASENCGYVRGLYHTAGGMQLYVSSGVSLWSNLPLRLGVPAEITLITIEPSVEGESAK